MKNNLSKFYIVAFYFCSTFIFAQPGTTDTSGTLENADTPPAPIDENLWILALIGLIFVFVRLKAIQAREINLK
jgi:hypothetical protein